MPNPVVHWEVLGKDGKRLQSFYTQLFNWEINADNPMQYGLVDTHTRKGINGGIGPAPEGPRVVIYVEVKDLAGYLKKVEKLGGKTVMPPTDIPNMVTFALFSDPEGNVVGLVSLEVPGPGPTQG